jgi:hypothetical protein
VFTFVLCLTACAMRAIGAMARIFRFLEPGPQRIVERADMDSCDVLTHRAAELLRAADVASQIGRVKVGLLRAAAWWFRLAILNLAVLGALIATYAIARPQPPARLPSSTSQTSMSTPAPSALPRRRPHHRTMR